MMQQTACVLVLTDVAGDADLVLRLLNEDFPRSYASTEPLNFQSDFERLMPQVLLFACRTIEASRQHCLNLHRNSKCADALPHVSLVLCDKREVQQGFELCQADFFDDYVPFWPIADDPRRLPMSMHLALRALHSQTATGSMAQIDARARRIASLDAQLDETLQAGSGHLADARHALSDVRKTLDVMLHRLDAATASNGGTDGAASAVCSEVRSEMGGLDGLLRNGSLDQTEQKLAQLQGWLDTLKGQIRDPLAALRALAERSARKQPRIMVVDDDDIMRKLMGKILTSQGYDAQLVSNAFAALRALQIDLPDLILMDVQMPTINGIQLTRRLKEIDAYAAIPVVMLTGRGERQIFLESREAGAVDCMVKPFEREVLLQKLRCHLHQAMPVDGIAA